MVLYIIIIIIIAVLLLPYYYYITLLLKGLSECIEPVHQYIIKILSGCERPSMRRKGHRFIHLLLLLIIKQSDIICQGHHLGLHPSAAPHRCPSRT